MRIDTSTFVLLGVAFLAACGGEVITGGGGSGGGAGTTATKTKTKTAPSCGGLDFCGCAGTEGCEVVYGDCICGCDYACPGAEPCNCVCGGGPYFGCAPSTCPGPFHFEGKDEVTFDAAGCPVVVSN